MIGEPDCVMQYPLDICRLLKVFLKQKGVNNDKGVVVESE